MVSQGRSPILERLLSDCHQSDTITATRYEQNCEGRNNQMNQSEFLYQTQSQVVPYLYVSQDNLSNSSSVSQKVSNSSTVSENSAHYFNPSGVLWRTEDFNSVSSSLIDATVPYMPNLLSRVQEPCPFNKTLSQDQVLTDAQCSMDANFIRESNNWENPSSTTTSQFHNETSNRLWHFTLPLNHFPLHQNGIYPNFPSVSYDVNNQLYPEVLPHPSQTDLCTPYIGYDTTLTDTSIYQPQMQVSGEISNEPNSYEFNFVPQYFFNQCQVLESQATNKIQDANLFEASNCLYDNECQLSANQGISEDCTQSRIFESKPLSHQLSFPMKEQSRKSSCIYENYDEASVSNFDEKLIMVDAEERKGKKEASAKEASLSKQEKAQVHKSPKGKGSSRKWPCSVCGRILARASTLKIHLRQHSGDRPFKCSLCPRTFTQQSLLDSHHRTHSNVRPYACAFCDKTFVHLSAYKTHTRTHTGERPHICPVPNCGMAFTDTSTLSKHARVHSGARPYVCDICNRRFTQSGNMNKHRKTVHKVTNTTKIEENTKILSEILGNNENTTSAMS